MTTTILHASVQRSRFSRHTTTALAGLMPATWRLATAAFRSASATTVADSAAVEAQTVRRLAQSYAKTDPGFAADLYAAAARHESQHGD
jgi:hypothetical protein